MITNQDRAAVRRIFAKCKDETGQLIRKRAAEAGVVLHPQMPNIIAAQNAMRVCLEVILNECIPYDGFYCAEMATRLATYVISAAPIEQHADLLEATIGAMPAALANKIREGAVIRSTWLTNGVEHPNIPEKGEIQ